MSTVISFKRILSTLKYTGFLAVLAGCFQALALEVHFLRHGETAWNRAKVLQGSIPYTELTARGVRMAEETARGMAAAGIRYDRIYASHLRRAYRTAEIVAKAQGMKPVVDPRLREMGMGKYEGMRYVKGEYPDENLRNFFEGTGPYVPTGEGAESMDDVAVRLKAFLDEVVRPLEGKADKVLCVAHSFVLKTLVREFAGDGASEAAKNPIQRNCCVHVLECKNGRFSVKETGRIYYDAKDFEVQPEPIMVAHRGAGDINGYRRESTKAAYSNAVATVCDVVKLDLQETRDKVVVLHHDPTLKRVMAWDAKISDLDYAEIYEKGRYLGPGHKIENGTERIVRLDEALEITRSIPQFWIDFKYFSPEFAEKVLKTFRDARIDFGRIMVATFNSAALEYFQKNHPSIRRISHVSWRYCPETKVFWGSMRTGKMPTREKVMECVLGHIKKYGLYGVNIPQSHTTAHDVKMLHDNGVKWVSLYFVQNTERAVEVRPWGADAFVTDYVSKVRKAYESGKTNDAAPASDNWSKYVPEFNRLDVELYANAISNSAAEAFLRENAPSFSCPDAELERIYHFRWWTYRKHLRRASSGGWVVTEFLPDVSWAGADNTISCPLGHQIREGRWLRNGEYLRDYMRFMATKGTINGPRSYTCWFAAGLLDFAKVTGDFSLCDSLFGRLVENYETWEKGWMSSKGFKVGFDPEQRLFHQRGDREGTEYALSPDGARPMANSAMWAEAHAIAAIARRKGESAIAGRFEKKAQALAEAVKTKLWNEEKRFFTAADTNGVLSSVCELHGYAPFYFGMPLETKYASAWRLLTDETGFYAPKGLVFPARNTPGFTVEPDYSGHECLWNGPSWPYATSIALSALGRELQSSGAAALPLRVPDFAKLLKQYAAQHSLVREDGVKVPWIDENLHPFTGEWLARHIMIEQERRGIRKMRYIERGKDYNHSTFCDLVISGLCGLVPRADGKIEVKPLAPESWDWWRIDGVRYHGHDLTILFDRDGSRYGKGKGLVVLKDGRKTQPVCAGNAAEI